MRFPVFIQCHNFTIDHYILFDLMQLLVYPGIIILKGNSVAGIQADVFFVYFGYSAVTVPFYFIDPVRVIKRPAWAL